MPVRRECEVCGAAFWVNPARTIEGRGRFCSLSCKGKVNHRPTGERVESRCVVCGVAFLSRPRDLERGRDKCCGHACAMVWRRRASVRARQSRLLTRVWANVDRSGGPDACWPWIGKTGRRVNRRGTGYVGTGYGVISYEGKSQRAHRVIYSLTFGPVAAGQHVLHRCPGRHNPNCCNPAHLALGSHTDNARDRERQRRDGHLRPLREVYPPRRRKAPYPWSEFAHTTAPPPAQ